MRASRVHVSVFKHLYLTDEEISELLRGAIMRARLEALLHVVKQGADAVHQGNVTRSRAAHI
jgi:hypothetical protein